MDGKDSKSPRLVADLKRSFTLTTAEGGNVECVPIWEVKPKKFKTKDETDLSQLMRSIEQPHMVGNELVIATAAIFPEHHNPFLEKALVKKLLLMDASDFCEILRTKRLSNKEISFLMRSEEFRRKSFEVDWPHGEAGQLGGDNMARCGLYLEHNINDTDMVCCAFCNLGLAQWQPNQNPHAEHLRHTGNQGLNCPFLHSPQTCDNKPIPEAFQYGNNFTQYTIYAQPESYGVNIDRPAMPAFSREQSRNDSFDGPNCPDVLKQLKAPLVRAGFYYTEDRDIVQCFDCGLKLYKWRERDDPSYEHVKYMSDCRYVQQQMPQEYIRDITSTLPKTRKSVNILENRVAIHPDSDLHSPSTGTHASPILTNTEPARTEFREEADISSGMSREEIKSTAQELKSKLTCKICLSAIVRIIFLPCGHLACCVQCAGAVDRCPICRGEIAGTIRAQI